MFTQMTADAGIKKHGQVAVDALIKEFAQLHEKKVFEGLHPERLTTEEKKNSLPSINLIKEKRDGKIKGRSVADGRKQHKIFSKEEITSPTVSTDALLMTLIIDAMEEREVGTADVPGAYLQADMEDYVILKMTGRSVDALCETDKAYKEFVATERGKRVIYLRLKKALYGCIKSAMLWYNLFTENLSDMGFNINPYDTCVANKVINGKQCTIVWYVDDLKVSHVEREVVLNVLQSIEERFSGELTINTGRKHVYLGMDITFTGERTVQIKMKDYLVEAIDAFTDDINKNASTPAKKDLFAVDEESPRLDKKRDELFKHIVAKLLYVSKRSRLDIQLAIGFLCTRVSCATVEDWEKLKRTLQYLRGTLDDFLTLGADNLEFIQCWIDASFAVHSDMKSHTGGVVSLGRGSVMSLSSKQKLNTNSTTESELVGCADGTRKQAIYGSLFLKAQGYIVKPVVYQDNESAIRLERNGRRSCSQKTRHIDIRYFYLKDLVERGVIEIEYCPTEAMIADFFTKPLQGALFNRLKEVIMGKVSIREFIDSLATKERVGDNVAADRNKKVTVETHRLKKFATYADCVRCSSQQTKVTLKGKDTLGKDTLKKKDLNKVQI